jgi:hypothetical protein
MHPRGRSALDQEPKTVPNPGLGTGQEGLTTCTFGQHVGAELEPGYGPASVSEHTAAYALDVGRCS